jgi:hypothetical protein
MPLRETLLGDALHDHILDATCLAECSFLRFVSIFVHSVDIRFDEGDFRFGVHPALPRGDQALFDITNGLYHVSPLLLREQRVAFSLE